MLLIVLLCILLVHLDIWNRVESDFNLECPSGAQTLASRHYLHLSCIMVRFIFSLSVSVSVKSK